MDRNPIGAVLIAAGSVFVVFSALADVIGIGEGGFGWKQILGVIIGAVVTQPAWRRSHLSRARGAEGAQAHA